MGMTKEPLFTPKEVAGKLGVQPNTVYMWVKKGRMVAFQAGKRSHIRISATELRRLGYPA
jgi:excisionase family DNA binding protein